MTFISVLGIVKMPPKSSFCFTTTLTYLLQFYSWHQNKASHNNVTNLTDGFSLQTLKATCSSFGNRLKITNIPSSFIREHVVTSTFPIPYVIVFAANSFSAVSLGERNYIFIQLNRPQGTRLLFDKSILTPFSKGLLRQKSDALKGTPNLPQGVAIFSITSLIA